MEFGGERAKELCFFTGPPTRLPCGARVRAHKRKRLDKQAQLAAGAQHVTRFPFLANSSSSERESERNSNAFACLVSRELVVSAARISAHCQLHLGSSANSNETAPAAPSLERQSSSFLLKNGARKMRELTELGPRIKMGDELEYGSGIQKPDSNSHFSSSFHLIPCWRPGEPRARESAACPRIGRHIQLAQQQRLVALARFCCAHSRDPALIECGRRRRRTLIGMRMRTSGNAAN